MSGGGPFSSVAAGLDDGKFELKLSSICGLAYSDHRDIEEAPLRIGH